MKTRAVLFSILLAGFLVVPAHAAELKAPETSDKSGNITLDAAETTDNLYIAGSNVTVDTLARKDVVAAGGTITVNQTVNHSVFAAGGTVNIKSDVDQSVRVAGGIITVSGTVGEDVLAAGGTVTIEKDAVVNGDLLIAGGSVTIDGKVLGVVRVSGGDVVINGEVGKDVYAKDVENLTLGSKSVINGKLTYSSPNKADIATTAKVVGGVDYHKIIQNNGFSRSFADMFLVGSLVKALSWLLLALILVYGFAKTTGSVVKEIKTKFWISLGIGFVAMIIVPVAALLLLITYIGAGLSVILMMIMGLVLMLTGSFAAIWLGSEVVRIISKSDKGLINWLSALVGVIIMMLLTAIPVIGWLALIVIYLASFGALVRLLWVRFPEKA